MSRGTLALLNDNDLLRAENARWLAEIDRLREDNKLLRNMVGSLDVCTECDRLKAENERLREALEEIKRLNEMSGFNGCAIAEVYSKHLPTARPATGG